jgi:hypothetical protein
MDSQRQKWSSKAGYRGAEMIFDSRKKIVLDITEKPQNKKINWFRFWTNTMFSLAMFMVIIISYNIALLRITPLLTMGCRITCATFFVLYPIGLEEISKYWGEQR